MIFGACGQLFARAAAEIPNVTLTVIEHAGHVSNVDRPNVFNARVREFLAKIDG